MAGESSQTQMEYRFLGRTGLKVSVLGLGGWLTQGTRVDDGVAMNIIKAAYDVGINYFDTAEVYAAGGSERVLGNAIKKFNLARSNIVISTKIYWGGPGVNNVGLSRKHIIEGTYASLRRLQLDYVDLIFAHRPDEYTPMEEIVRAFNFVIEQGKAFYWGTSEWSAEQITEAIGIANKLNLIAPAMEQPEYNMFHRERFEKEFNPLYKKFGLGTTIWSPLASGVLTGKYMGGKIPPGSRLDPSNVSANRYLLPLQQELQTEVGHEKNQKMQQLKNIADNLDISLAQMALAWCIKNPHVSSVITGSTKMSQFEENIKALQAAKKLSPEIMSSIDNILHNTPVMAVPRMA